MLISRIKLKCEKGPYISQCKTTYEDFYFFFFIIDPFLKLARSCFWCFNLKCALLFNICHWIV